MSGTTIDSLSRIEKLEPSDLILCVVERDGQKKDVVATVAQIAEAVNALLKKS